MARSGLVQLQLTVELGRFEVARQRQEEEATLEERQREITALTKIDSPKPPNYEFNIFIALEYFKKRQSESTFAFSQSSTQKQKLT